MPTPLPREPSGNSPLHQTIKQIKKILRELRLIPTAQYSVDHFPDGQALRFKQEKTQGGGGGKFKFRGMWMDGEQYFKNDVVIIRAGQFTAGSGNYNHGTFFCVLDHVASAANQPSEPTFNQGETALDPLGSTGPTDIWRTLAQGNWNDFVVAPYPGELPAGVIPFNYARMRPGNVEVASGTSTSALNGFLKGGAASGSGGGSSWTIDVSDLPPGENLKIRGPFIFCINGEKFTGYIPVTVLKPVP